MQSALYLPYQYSPREYQKPLWNALFKEQKKRAACVWHRRAGKDKTCLNLIIAKSQERVGGYYYLFPELKQANRVIWKGIDREGKRFIDHFPSELVRRINNADMTVEFHNGSIFKLGGSDRYDALMGSNPVGVIFSEYSLQNPRAWDLIRPILAENNGWALFNYTPRGQNHGYELYEKNKDNPNWFVEILTVRDTFRDDGTPVISEEIIEEERRSGMSDDLIEQEFYCSFRAAVQGAYFSRQLKQAEETGRICDFAVDTRLPVNTYWDLGYDDKTAIWLIQPFRHNELRAIAYYENCGEGLSHYVNWLHDFRAKTGVVFNEHYLPHDAEVTELGTGISRSMTLRNLGLNPIRVVPRVKNKLDAIEAARGIFPLIWFHKTQCKEGLACLREYHTEYNEKTHAFSHYPKHNWASNGADAFMQLAQSWRENRENEKTYYENRVNQGQLL